MYSIENVVDNNEIGLIRESKSIEDRINDLFNEFEVPVFGPDRLIDVKRMTNLFTIINGSILLKAKNPQSIWSILSVYLKQKGDPVYRSAKNIVLAYKYIMMSNQQKNQLVEFLKSQGFRDRYRSSH